MGKSKFLISDAKEAFNQLWQTFIKALFLQHFNPNCHIRIETNVSGYILGKILSQLIFNQLNSQRLADQLISR